MGARPVDDKASDTLVAGLRRRALDGEFDSPPSPPALIKTRHRRTTAPRSCVRAVPLRSRRGLRRGAGRVARAARADEHDTRDPRVVRVVGVLPDELPVLVDADGSPD